MLKKFTHIVLASLVLLSSTGLVTHLHYCQNELKEVSFFLETDPCPKEKVEKPCPMHMHSAKHEMPAKKDCCEDETHVSKITTEQEAQPFEVRLIQDFLALAIIPTSSLKLQDLRVKAKHYLNYKPPLLICEPQSSLQVFLC